MTVTETYIPQAKNLWEKLGYVPVRGLQDRIIARYLRGQRKNMERFFRERGLLDSAERMRQIRLSRQGMMAKNAMFQKVLDDYAKLITPVQPATGEAPVPTVEAAYTETEGSRVVDVPPSGDPVAVSGTDVRSDAGESVPEVADADVTGVVIEE